MRYATSIIMSVAALVLTITVSPSLTAQTPAPANETATQFYVRYLDAFAKATKVEDILPYMAAENRKMVESTPVGERSKMFEMIKVMSGMNTGVKVTGEKRTATGATLTAEATGPDKAKVTGTIDIVREGNAWKLGKESWKG
jgi:hypothetical protein